MLYVWCATMDVAEAKSKKVSSDFQSRGSLLGSRSTVCETVWTVSVKMATQFTVYVGSSESCAIRIVCFSRLY